MKKIVVYISLLMLIVACKHQNNDIDVLEKDLNVLMDQWHHSAAVADEDFFFGLLDSNSVYLGTDPGERWLKHEFMDWGLKYFQRDTAWAFIPYDRVWGYSSDFQYAWFDELLETHMGICRGSGVLKNYKGMWKIQQYNLALTLPNGKMNDFRKLQDVPVK